MKIIKTVVTDICFIVVLFWVLASSLICLFTPVSVSAETYTGSISDSWFDSDFVVPSDFDDFISALKSNTSLSSFDSLYVFGSYDSSNGYYVNFINPINQYTYTDGSNSIAYMGDLYVGVNYQNLNQISSYNYSFTNYNSPPDSYQGTNSLVYNTNNTYSLNSTFYYRGQLTYGSKSGLEFVVKLSFAYEPVPSIDTPLSLNINVDGFYNWLVDTHKDSNFVSYFNLRALSQYLQFYSAWGSAPQKFLVYYNIEFGDSYGDHLSNTQIISLKNLTDKLYREYLNSLKYPPADFPSRDRVDVRKDIDTNTTDNNTVLITDDSNDSVIVSILRDILRGVIALRNQIFVTGSDIITGLNNLDFTVNVANDGGIGFSASDIWGSGDITESENYLALTAAFMDKGVDVSAAENMQINYLDNATQADSFTVSVVMPDQYVNGQFTEKTVTHTIDNTSKMYNTLILFRKLIAFAVVAYFAIRIRFELPHLIRGE